MDSNMLDTVTSADWHVKALFTGAILLLTVLANAWVNKFWLSGRLRKYPITNRGEPQVEFNYEECSIRHAQRTRHSQSLTHQPLHRRCPESLLLTIMVFFTVQGSTFSSG